MTPSFCSKCGSPTRLTPRNGFNPFTGQPLQRAICVKEGCRHSGHDCYPHRASDGRFGLTARLIGNPVYICKTCNARDNNDGGIF